jgi:Raf kinase inhibitor-like YbhB/YbcL family protein
MRTARNARTPYAAMIACAIFLSSCGNKTPLVEGPSTIELQIPAFTSLVIPSMYTCDGSDTSPALSWSQPPANTQSLALTIVDTDTPIGFVHWVLFNIPAQTREFQQGLPKQATLPDGSQQGMTDFDKVGYGGPCPPSGSPHHYVFTLYALDTKLNLPANATRKQLESAMKGHILANGQFTAHYQRHQK